MSRPNKKDHEPSPKEKIRVERVQTGVMLEKRMVKVLKAVAEYHDIGLGELLEGIILHSFDGACAFGKPSLKLIAELKKLYHLDLSAKASHKLVDKDS